METNKDIEQLLLSHAKGFRCACGKENGLTYSYHSGRHSFASLITLEAGVPMETICKMLGHKDVKMTQRYARVTQKKAHPSFHLSQRCFLSFARLLKIVLKNIINKIITWIDVNNTK